MWRELRPSPDRWSGAAQITLLCVLTVAMSMILRVPEAALSCYLIFFAWKDDSGSMIVTGLILIMAASLGLPLVQPLLRLAVDSSAWRLGLLCGITLFGMMLAHASRAGPMLGTAAFILAFAVTLYDVVPVPDLLSRALAWMWVVVFIPMALLIGVGIFLGTSPKERAEQLIARRREALAAPQSEAAIEMRDDGGTRMDVWLSKAWLLGFARGDTAARLAAEAEASYLDLVRAQAGLPPRAGPPAPAFPADKAPLFEADLFSNPAHLRFGVKVLIAVIITYVTYTVAGLSEIHTAMITCYFVALSTGGETRHKITLRLTGAVMGGLLGTLVLFILMPHMHDLGHLTLLVVLGAFPAAWIGVGSERVAYAGWQMALCYFLVILGGFGPSMDPMVALNRIIGVAFGIVVVWGVFSLLWPVSAARKVDELLDQFDTEIAALTGYTLSGRAAMRLNALVAEAERLYRYASFEGAQEIAHAHRIDEARQRMYRQLRYATGEPHA